MKCSPQIFRQMLKELDFNMALNCSTWNHHVAGLNYLCLHRSPRLTVKLYLIENPQNPNNGFLVNPHSHRYAFWTMALHGRLGHIRFVEPKPGKPWHRTVMDEYGYHPDSRTMQERRRGVSLAYAPEHIPTLAEYFVEPHEVHTLKMITDGRPLLLGLVQFADTQETSSLYLPAGSTEFRPSLTERRPLVSEVQDAQARCLQLLEMTLDGYRPES